MEKEVETTGLRLQGISRKMGITILLGIIRGLLEASIPLLHENNQ